MDVKQGGSKFVTPQLRIIGSSAYLRLCFGEHNRNTWLFADTTDGAEATSLLYSLVITAKLNGKDPFTVMVEILRQLPHAKTIDDYEKLTDLLLTKEKVPIGRDGNVFHYQQRVQRAHKHPRPQQKSALSCDVRERDQEWWDYLRRILSGV